MLLSGLLLVDPREAPQPGWVEVDRGVIVAVESGSPPGAVDLGGPGAVIAPGFIDAHVHLPQIDAIGFDGLELIEWLDRVIFPAEAVWFDPELARRQAEEAFRRFRAAGTLGFAGYLTSHEHAAAALDRAAERHPLRGRAGQVLMDRRAPDDLIGHEPVRPGDVGRVTGSVNPRFAVSCSDALLARAAALAGPDGWIQTHLSESRVECAIVGRLFPDDPNYTSVYDRHGLLTPRTLLAHALHLDEAEWRLIAERGATVVHCPAANTFLAAGAFDLGAARRHGVRVALGSDVAAGPDLAMPRVARSMIDVAKLRSIMGADPAPIPTPAEAWTMITRGNADALGWSDAGRLEVGATADLLVLRPPFELDEHLVSRLIHTWDETYIAHRVVAGVA